MLLFFRGATVGSTVAPIVLVALLVLVLQVQWVLPNFQNSVGVLPCISGTVAPIAFLALELLSMFITPFRVPNSC